MPKLRTALVCLLCAGALSAPLAGQSAEQLRPELGIYSQQGDIFRLEFEDVVTGNLTTQQWNGNFSFYVRAALKPVFRRDLRKRADVYRERYLSFRAGYRHVSGLTNDSSTSENRGIVELIAQYYLPWKITISDRSRGEFRAIKGQPFSERYRNKLQVAHDIGHEFVWTPYIYDEVFYDTRYDSWNTNRLGIGVELPIGAHVVLEPTYYRQHTTTSNPPYTNTYGLKLGLYF